MNQYEMVAVIVMVAVIGGVLRSFIKSRSGTSVAGMNPDESTRLAKLEERVRALESVVGDGSYELKQKFKDLEKP